jgi:hypothetical protein
MKPPTTQIGGSSNNSISKKSHCELVLEHLESGRSLTFLESLELFNCRALSQRVGELRRKGYEIRTEMVETPDGAKIASYSLEPKERPQ